MVFNQVKKEDTPRSSTGLVIAAFATFVLLLAALFHVVTGQVEQAGFRQAQYNAAQVAIAGCAASYSGEVRRQCMEQVNAGFMSQPGDTLRLETGAQGGVSAMPDAQGFQQTAYTYR
jgi:hypothetical protein